VRWGQNFLVDRNIAEHIVSWADIDGGDVVEIGPGKGALTEMLAQRAGRLALVEIDPELARSWQQRFENDSRVAVYHADALELDLSAVSPLPVSVVANLPYETGTAIVRRLLTNPADLKAAVVMLQKEVCERLLARPGNKSFGVLALHTQLVADVHPGRVVPASCFRPQPKVSSQLVRIVPLPRPRYEVGSLRIFEQLVSIAFTQRRKMLRNSVGKWIDERLGEGQGLALLDTVGILPDRRPETVDVETFAALSARLHVELEHRA
jgi:16S rRNA (adenine1518-N6/adenine1519-N6)-dimethyltransferase